MAVPKKKASKARTRRLYHINSRLTIPELYRDPQSDTLVQRHHVNLVSGVYRDGVYIVKKEREKTKSAS